MRQARPNKLARFFDAVGYLLTASEWLVLGLLYMPRLLDTQFVQDYLTAPNEVKTTPVKNANAVEPSMLLIAFTTAAGVIFLLFVGYIIFRRYVPAVVRTSEKTIEKTAQEIVHVQEKHKPRMTAQKRRLFTHQTQFYLRLCVGIIPLALILLLPSSDSLPIVLAKFCIATASFVASCCFVISRYIGLAATGSATKCS